VAQGHQVETLIGKSRVEASNFTYWVPPPPPPSLPGAPAPPSSQSRPQPVKARTRTRLPAAAGRRSRPEIESNQLSFFALLQTTQKINQLVCWIPSLRALLGRRRTRLFWQAPDFYEKAPPAPPGLVWYEYRDDVPPLPQPAEYFNSSRWAGWVWRYDENFQISDYTFSNLDLTTMANVGAGDPRVWVHIVSAWVISWFAWRVRGAPHAAAAAPRRLGARPGGTR
jgi:hypothetical protein